jgi:hypothetical protein
MIRNSTIGKNSIGIAADQNSKIQVSQTTVTANGTGWQATNGGHIQSYKNNNLSGNTIDGIEQFKTCANQATDSLFHRLRTAQVASTQSFPAAVGKTQVDICAFESQ